MHLLYADESGTTSDPKLKYFVLAGVAVFERNTHWIEVELNKIASRFNASDPHAVELHGSPMRQGRDGWHEHSRESREQAIKDALTEGVVKNYPKCARIFAVALEKQSFAGKDVAQIAFEQLSSRFDQFLGRLYRDYGDRQRGLILFDNCSTGPRIQSLAREFKATGHSFGITRNYADVPVFMDSKASRLIQLADLVAYAVFRYFEHGDDTYYKVIANCFDREGSVVHGLYKR